MNAERLHAIAIALNKEMKAIKTVEKIQNLKESLDNTVNQNHPQYQEELAKNLQIVDSSLASCPSDNFSPAWRQLLSELGGDNLFGLSLHKQIQNIFQTNAITPAVALKQLEALLSKLEAFKEGLENLLSSFQQFKIGNEQLEPGQCEIGMLIPRDAVKNQLPNFAQELKELVFILNTFSEVATGNPEELTIKTISSSDLTVYLDGTARFAACLAVAIERIVALYQRLLEIKKSKAELEKHGVPEEDMAGITAHANNLMSDGIETLTVEIIEKYHPAKDGHRKNELKNAIRISLNRIANRIDRGYNIEVRAEPLKQDKKPEGESDGNEARNLQEAINTIQAAAKNMQFLKLGGSPILRLKESETEKPKKEQK